MAIMRKFRMARRRHLKNSAAEKYSRVKSLAAVDYHHPLLSLGISSRTSLVFRKAEPHPQPLVRLVNQFDRLFVSAGLGLVLMLAILSPLMEKDVAPAVLQVALDEPKQD